MYGPVRCILIAVALVATQSTFAQSAAQSSPSADEADKPRQVTLEDKPWAGDFDGMLERRVIRIFVPFSRTLYFNDKGRERGLTAENARDFELYLNEKYRRKLRPRPLTIVLIPATRDRLLSAVVDGQADIAAGDLTVTEERLKRVDMIAPEGGPQVREILLTGPKSPEIKVIDDLSGKTVHVRRTTSYYESLVALNERFRKEGKEEVKLVLVPDALEDEDMMDMLDAGLFQAIVVNDWLAKIWAPVLPKLVVHDDVVLREEGRIGWAIRKQSPLLAAEINTFYAKFLKREDAVARRIQELTKRVKALKDPTGAAARKRFNDAVALFEKYGHQYDFDPLMLTAQGYQESQLDQRRRSPVGAVGVMQIMPATGKLMRVGDIHQIDANVHAGTKYMDYLMSQYFADAHFDETDRMLFAFASYNCGPNRIATARKMAASQHLDADRWFNNVEITTGKRCGTQTTTYVRNIFKYYVTYKLIVEAQEKEEKARGAIGVSGSSTQPQAGTSAPNK
jgi:membrane-bound lytic murein transglycosylase MltF